MRQYETINLIPIQGASAISGKLSHHQSAPLVSYKKDETMKEYEVVIRVPSYVEKTIYVDDATSKTDARKKVKKEILEGTICYDSSADEWLGQFMKQAKIISVKGDK